MKTRIKISLLVLSFLSILFIFPFFTQNSKANLQMSSSNDIDYVFNKAKPYDVYSDNLTLFNLRHNDICTEYYNASYSFDNEIGLTNYSITFIDKDDTNEEAYEVKSNVDSHNTILELFDNSAVDNNDLYHYGKFNSSTGILECYVRTSDSTKGFNFYMNEYSGGYQVGILLQISNGFLRYRDSVNTWIPLSTITNNIWYHVSIDFDCTTDYFDLTLNGYEYRHLEFNNDITEVGVLRLYTGGGTTGVYNYFDAIGMTWYSNYTLNDNIQPYIITTPSSQLTTDKYEFMLDDTSNPYQNGVSDDFYGWSEQDGLGTKLEYDDNEAKNYGYKNGGIVLRNSPSNVGFYNDTLNIHGTDINITFGLQFLYSGEIGGTVKMYIDALNTTKVIDFKIEIVSTTTFTISYYDGSSYQVLDTLFYLHKDNEHSFNLYLYNHTCSLRYYLNRTYNSTYSFDFIHLADGIDSLEFYNMATTNDIEVRFNYVGIYQYNISYCILESSYFSYYYGILYDSDYYNLYQLITNNTLIGGITTSKALYYNSYTQLHSYESVYTENLLESSITKANASIYFILNNTYNLDFTNFSYSLEGVKLTKNSTDYYPIYEYINTDVSHGYFYVSNNRLYHYLNITSNGNYERIRISFDIENIICINRSITFKSLYYGVGSAGLNITYGTGKYDFQLFIYRGYVYTRNIVLPQTYTIDNISIYASDGNSSFYTNEINTGYITDLSFLYLPDIDITLSTIAITTLLIPLLVILGTSLTIRTVFGKNMFLLFFIFMSLICMIVNILEGWIFLIMCIAIGCLIYIQNRKGGLREFL